MKKRGEGQLASSFHIGRMGNVTLSPGRVDSAALAGNAFVQRFISPEHLDARDPFWNQMLSFQVQDDPI